MKEPSYRSTRLYLWASAIAAWLVIIILAAAAAFGSEQAVAFGQIAMTPLISVIVGVLGVHRGFGSVDFWAQAKALSENSKERSDEKGAD